MLLSTVGYSIILHLKYSVHTLKQLIMSREKIILTKYTSRNTCVIIICSALGAWSVGMISTHTHIIYPCYYPSNDDCLFLLHVRMSSGLNHRDPANLRDRSKSLGFAEGYIPPVHDKSTDRQWLMNIRRERKRYEDIFSFSGQPIHCICSEAFLPYYCLYWWWYERRGIRRFCPRTSEGRILCWEGHCRVPSIWRRIVSPVSVRPDIAQALRTTQVGLGHVQTKPWDQPYFDGWLCWSIWRHIDDELFVS